MSHTGNWPRSPRKMALEVERSRRELERLQDAGPGREVIFEIDEPLLKSHPCHAVGKDWNVSARCTCGRVRWVPLRPMLEGPLAHAPWPRVMQSMACETCGGQPVELAFDTEPRGVDMKRVRFAYVRVRLA